MSTKRKYYQIFGLDETASKAEVKRAYRKIAKELHPDTNPDPKAHQLFVDLAEAYERILNDDFPGHSKERKEKTTEERKKEAEIRLKQQQARKIKEQEHYYKKMTSGRLWSIYRTYAKVAAILSLLLLIDPMLPTHQEEHVLTHFSPKYSGLVDGSVTCFKTDKNLEVFINSPSPSLHTSEPRVTIERSWLFHNPVKVWQVSGMFLSSYEIDFSVNSLFPCVPILFLIPLATYYYRRKNHWFTLMYLFSYNLIGLCFIYFLLAQERWAHLLSLGFF